MGKLYALTLALITTLTIYKVVGVVVKNKDFPPAGPPGAKLNFIYPEGYAYEQSEAYRQWIWLQEHGAIPIILPGVKLASGERPSRGSLSGTRQSE